MRLRLLSAQPATDYYAWQVEVYLHNFLKLGYNGNYMDVVAGYNGSIPESWRKIQNRFPYVRFFFYENTMENDTYPPAIQSHILEKHFKQHPYLQHEAIFFHDCDFIFTKFFDFNPYLSDDSWYFSDTISYIGSEYIRSKGEEVLDVMCKTVGIPKQIVVQNQTKSGGAQKLMKNVTADYWKEVYDNSIALYEALKTVSHIKKDTDPNGIQVWTASMWAELWTAWKRGFNVEVPKEFNFCWATCHVDRWEDMYFFHNAGVPDSKGGMFFKAEYINKLPYNTNLELDKNRCSYKYYSQIKSIDSCLA